MVAAAAVLEVVVEVVGSGREKRRISRGRRGALLGQGTSGGKRRGMFCVPFFFFRCFLASATHTTGTEVEIHTCVCVYKFEG